MVVIAILLALILFVLAPEFVLGLLSWGVTLVIGGALVVLAILAASSLSLLDVAEIAVGAAVLCAVLYALPRAAIAFPKATAFAVKMAAFVGIFLVLLTGVGVVALGALAAQDAAKPLQLFCIIGGIGIATTAWGGWLARAAFKHRWP